MPNSRTPHPLATFNIPVSISMVARKKHHKYPNHPSKVQGMNCFTANACGRCFRFTSLHFRSYTSFRHLTFHSVHCQPQPWQPTQECLLHSIALMPAHSFIPLPFGFPTHNPQLEAKTGSYIPPLPIRYIAFSHHPCFSPCQPAVCPA